MNSVGFVVGSSFVRGSGVRHGICFLENDDAKLGDEKKSKRAAWASEVTLGAHLYLYLGRIG